VVGWARTADGGGAKSGLEEGGGEACVATDAEGGLGGDNNRAT
jgi:hypothetical protein